MENQKNNILIPITKSKNKSNCKVFPTSEYVLYFDGCSKGNPGHSGIGAVLYKNEEEVWASHKYIGSNKTNNEAEYSALILGLKQSVRLNITSLSVCGDSLLVINQINGVYKVRHPKLLTLYETAMNLKQQFDYIDFNHVYRCDNKRADHLSNIALNILNLNSEHEPTSDLETEYDSDTSFVIKMNSHKLLTNNFLPPINKK
jgi:ribonuclease HI